MLTSHSPAMQHGITQYWLPLYAGDLAITFVGFTGIVVILRQSLGSKFLPIKALVAQFFMVEGFTIGYCHGPAGAGRL